MTPYALSTSVVIQQICSVFGGKGHRFLTIYVSSPRKRNSVKKQKYRYPCICGWGIQPIRVLHTTSVQHACSLFASAQPLSKRRVCTSGFQSGFLFTGITQQRFVHVLSVECALEPHKLLQYHVLKISLCRGTREIGNLINLFPFIYFIK